MKKISANKIRFDKNTDIYVGKILRFGVILSCCITMLGGVLYLYQHHGKMADYSPVPFGEPFGVADYLRSFSTVLSRIAEADGAAVIQLGVMILIATPVFRVIFSVAAFLIEKDYLYVAVTLLVLAIILANMILGIH
ncbi:MAG: DUF1634 domain-containing protein [Prevotellaceae bacterium]|jgi:uncharacterized membrane protein|nr:DUF1634 domain-containing protein [Prevotellaceae bacterium]